MSQMPLAPSAMGRLMVCVPDDIDVRVTPPEAKVRVPEVPSMVKLVVVSKRRLPTVRLPPRSIELSAERPRLVKRAMLLESGTPEIFQLSAVPHCNVLVLLLQVLMVISAFQPKSRIICHSRYVGWRTIWAEASPALIKAFGKVPSLRCFRLKPLLKVEGA